MIFVEVNVLSELVNHFVSVCKEYLSGDLESDWDEFDIKIAVLACDPERFAPRPISYKCGKPQILS